jgi:hypothetical protein
MLKYDCKKYLKENVIIMKKVIIIVIMKMRYINQVTIFLKKVFQHWNYDEKINTSKFYSSMAELYK